jgi:hypothetical protein
VLMLPAPVQISGQARDDGVDLHDHYSTHRLSTSKPCLRYLGPQAATILLHHQRVLHSDFEQVYRIGLVIDLSLVPHDREGFLWRVSDTKVIWCRFFGQVRKCSEQRKGFVR